MPSLYLTNQEVSFLLPLVRDGVRQLDARVAKIKRNKSNPVAQDLVGGIPDEDSPVGDISEAAESLEGIGTKLQTALWQANYSGKK